MFEGLIGLIHLILAIWAIVNIVGSSTTTLKKILWTIIRAAFPRRLFRA